ncbi:MAG: hypothetical protein ACJA0Y_002565 [Maricaulis maris]|jgi:hypothetical protein
MRNPFRYFKTSLEIIRLAVMMYIRKTGDTYRFNKQAHTPINLTINQ